MHRCPGTIERRAGRWRRSGREKRFSFSSCRYAGDRRRSRQPLGSYDQLALGAGAVAAEAGPGDDENSLDLPGYARIHAAVSWRRDRGPRMPILAQLNVNSVTDVEYDPVSALTRAVEPGLPVRLVGSVALEF